MDRIRRYIDNAGLSTVLINTLLLGYIVYLQVDLALSGSAGLMVVLVIGVPAAVIGLVGPRLVLSALIERAATVMKAMRIGWFVVMGYVVLTFTGVIAGSVYAYVPILFAIFLFYGVQFWILSDERVLTGRALHVVRGNRES